MTVIGERTSSQSNKQVLDRPVVHVLHDRCAGCQECIVRCPTEALSLDPDNWIRIMWPMQNRVELVVDGTVPSKCVVLLVENQTEEGGNCDSDI